MTAIRIVFQIVVGLAFGIATLLALSPLFAAFPQPASHWSMFAAFGIVLLLSTFAPTTRRAFGRGFLCLGAAVFVLPFSALILGVVASNQVITQAAEADRGTTALGATIGTGLITGAAGFIGFIFGTVLLLIGLVLSLGGRREVVVIGRR
jgi:hypothetical protein